MFSRRTLLAGLLTIVASSARADNPAATSGASDDLHCGFTRTDAPGYVIWICNAAGTELSRDGVILWTRTSDAGAEVISPVWTGQVAELPKRVKRIISDHRRNHAGCTRYVHVARATPDGPEWNVAAHSAQPLLKTLRADHPGLCYTAHPAAADYVLAWGALGALPRAFSVQVPRQILMAPGENRPTEARFVDDHARALAAYRVVAGLDGAVLRLGMAVFESGAADASAGPTGKPVAFAEALESIRTVPR
jgi:hypothetical protein